MCDAKQPKENTIYTPFNNETAKEITDNIALVIAKETGNHMPAEIFDDLCSFLRLYLDSKFIQEDGVTDLRGNWFIEGILKACDHYAEALYG